MNQSPCTSPDSPLGDSGPTLETEPRPCRRVLIGTFIVQEPARREKDRPNFLVDLARHGVLTVSHRRFGAHSGAPEA